MGIDAEGDLALPRNVCGLGAKDMLVRDDAFVVCGLAAHLAC